MFNGWIDYFTNNTWADINMEAHRKAQREWENEFTDKFLAMVFIRQQPYFRTFEENIKLLD